MTTKYGLIAAPCVPRPGPGALRARRETSGKKESSSKLSAFKLNPRRSLTMSKVLDTPAAALTGTDVGGFVNSILTRVAKLPCAFRVHTQSGVTTVGEGEPEFDLYIRNDRGMSALKSLEELTIAEAYVRGDLDIEGDVVKAMWVRTFIA